MITNMKLQILIPCASLFTKQKQTVYSRLFFRQHVILILELQTWLLFLRTI